MSVGAHETQHVPHDREICRVGMQEYIPRKLIDRSQTFTGHKG